MRRALAFLPRRIGYVWGPRLLRPLRKLWVKLRHPQADIRFGSHSYLGPGFSLHMPRRRNVHHRRRGGVPPEFRCEVMGDRARHDR